MSTINLFEYPSFGSFWEYARACEVAKLLEAKDEACMISEHDHAELVQLRMRIADYEKLNEIETI